MGRLSSRRISIGGIRLLIGIRLSLIHIYTRTIYYNKDIFEQHGYKPSTSLADFEAMCDQMLADGIIPLTVAATEFSSLFHVYDFILCAVEGGPQFVKDTEAGTAKMNDPRGVAALEKYMSWKDKGYFSTASTGNDASAAVLEFAQGGTCLLYTSRCV